LARRLPRSAFRGQPDASQEPSTSIERAAARLRYDRNELYTLEERMLREARRRARQYVPHVPEHDDALGWLALLRHHGAPTRLLDFSQSFYVAVWFAIESADGDAAVWAVDLQRLREAAGARLAAFDPKLAELPPESWELAKAVLGRRDLGAGVVAVEPFQLDERLAAQQGMFLVSLDPSRSFVDNLAATFGVDELDFRQPPRAFGSAAEAGDALAASVVEVVLPQALHRPAREDLWRMNLTAASFFPGMDGFARSLLYYVGLHQPGEEWEKTSG
jgi:FRG domain-containing protein